MKAYRESRNIAPLILKTDASWKWLSSSRCRFPTQKLPPYPEITSVPRNYLRTQKLPLYPEITSVPVDKEAEWTVEPVWTFRSRMCGCFGNMCTFISCVLYCLYCVFCIVSFMYIYSYLFCLYLV